MIEKNLATSARPSGALSTADLAGTTAEPVRDDLVRTEDEPRGRSIPIVTQPPADGDPVRAQTPGGMKQAGNPAEEERGPLFAGDEATRLRARWDDVQAGFVDSPRQAVESADELVATTMKRLAEIFANERQTMEKQWESGDNVSTEDLRVALRRYRSFFGRLLAI